MFRHRSDYRRGAARGLGPGFFPPARTLHWPHHRGAPPPWQAQPYWPAYDVPRPTYPESFWYQYGYDESLRDNRLTAELERMAVPSPELQKSVRCVTLGCIDATQTLEGSQACACASLDLACKLGGDQLDPAALTFCAGLAEGGDLCSELNPALISGMTVTTAPQVLSRCFGDS